MDQVSDTGKFIVFEGLDGCGKSTQINLLVQYFSDKGWPLILTAEPYEEFPSGREIRRVLIGEKHLAPDELQLLFVENRKEHVNQIIQPAIKLGKTIISDRYFLSTIAHGSLGCDIEWLKDLNAEFPLPAVTFIIDVSAEECVRRIKSRGTTTQLFEKQGKLTRVRRVYKMLADSYPNVELIAGERSIEEVFEDIQKIAERVMCHGA